MALSFDITKFYFTSDFQKTATYNSSGDRYVIPVDPSKKERIYGEDRGYDPNAEMSILVKCSAMAAEPQEGDTWLIESNTYRASSVKKDTKGITYKIGLVSQYGKR